jgi:hypothetical protein
MNNKRIPKSDVINKIISRINDMYPYADPEKIKKCEEYLIETIKENENGKVLEAVNIDNKAIELAHMFGIVK